MPASSRIGPLGVLLALFLSFGHPAALRAQQRPAQAGADALRVFLDCQGGWRGACDREYFRQHIGYVNWVRQPQDAQVHIIVTSQGSGGGGTRYTLDFVGREELQGLTDQLTYTSLATDVEEETVAGLSRTLSLGLVRYLAQAGFGDAVDVESAPSAQDANRPAAATSENDPWNFWVFDINAGGSVDREDRQSSKELRLRASANRTTDQWKFDFRAGGNWQRERYDLTDSIVHNNQDNWSTTAFTVKSLGEHWGVGAEVAANNSTRLNRELLLSAGTGVEYNFFPYSESSRRLLQARYVISFEDVRYQDTTIYDLLQETAYQHAVSLSYEAREEWGNANIGVRLNQYLDRTSLYSVNVRGFVRYRLFRGFSVNVNGDYQVIRDQRYLPKAELSDEDILLGRRRLPTNSQTSLELSLSYSFGSIFNNAVNSRFDRGVL